MIIFEDIEDSQMIAFHPSDIAMVTEVSDHETRITFRTDFVQTYAVVGENFEDVVERINSYD